MVNTHMPSTVNGTKPTGKGTGIQTQSTEQSPPKRELVSALESYCTLKYYIGLNGKYKSVKLESIVIY